jgi:nitrate/TMAO reductase-like tetraheme cytochrome c subunit
MRVLLKALKLLLAGAAVLLLCVATYFAIGVLVREHPGVKPATVHPTLSRESCIDCHAGITAEWRESFHFQSLSGPFWERIRSKGYEPLFGILRIPCVNCHAPANVLDLPDGAHPVERTDAVRTGVDCVSCHVSERGILGPGRATQAPHEVVGDERFRDPVLASTTICTRCHEEQVSHAKTVTAWRATAFARDRVTCLECHMPMIEATPVAGESPRSRRSHRFAADKNLEMLRRALNASIDLTGDGNAVVRILNDRVGHSFPADGTNSLIVEVTVQDGQGQTVRKEERAFGTKETMPGYLDFWPFLQVTKIPYGESREIQVALPKGRGRVSAEFRYRDWFTVTNRDTAISTITREF